MMKVLWMCWLLASCNVISGSPSPEQVKVVIIGAGASGYAAGCRLLENNFTDFVVLEAQDRIGGRVHSVPFGHGSLDLGGEWVHGFNNNIVYDMAKPLDLLYTSKTMVHVRTLQSDGKRFGLNIFDKVAEFLLGTIAEVPAQVNGSRGEYVTKRYWEFIQPMIDENEVTRSEAESLLNFTEQMDNSLDASNSWFDRSPHAPYDRHEILENGVWKFGGYSTVFKILSKKIPNLNKQLKIDERVRLGKEVTLVDWSGDRVLVRCADGSEFNADRVLTTVSLNVLKATASSIFKPTLPQQNLNAIADMGMGTVAKIILEFPYRWWEPGVEGLALIWRKEDVEKLPEDSKWTSGLFSLNAPDNFPLNVLCGWLNGRHAEAMESLPESLVKDQVISVLRRFAGPDVPDAISIHRSQWFTNPFTRGSYSHRTVNSDAMNIWPQDLAMSVANSTGKTVLQFAGEATSEAHIGTVHGAIATGFREADKILNFYNVSNGVI